jgi:predicted Rossmann fold nucleotide-binding protein DprA/Smf involved in DNA uptake
LALCSALAAADPADGEPVSTLTLSEWNVVARKIEASPLERPAALIDRAAPDLAETLRIASTEADRIVGLLERGSSMALALEELFARGIWVVTRADPRYPDRLKRVLRHQAPPVLFGAGDLDRLERGGVAVVGSRQIDEPGIRFARSIGRCCAETGTTVISGGARGSDRVAMQAALESGGAAVGVLADSLDRTIRQSDLQQLLVDDRLVLLTPYLPTAGFSVGGAMGRNKLIYGLADYAVVVSSEVNKGGTWAGATETLKSGWCPLFVRGDGSAPDGNRELIKRGAAPLSGAVLAGIPHLPDWLAANQRVPPGACQQELLPKHDPGHI